MKVRQIRYLTRQLILGLLVVGLAAAPARATWISGYVFCDDGDGDFSPGDTPLDGVVVKAVSQDAEPGATFMDTSGDAFPDSPAEPGFYKILLPQRSDRYNEMLTGQGVPAGAEVIWPPNGMRIVEIVSGSGDIGNARKNGRNFLLSPCGPSGTTTTTVRPTTTSTSSTSSTTTPQPTTTSSTSPTPTTTTTSVTSTTLESTSTSSTVVTSTTSTTTPLSVCEEVLDHLKCYKTRRRSRFRRTQVNLGDQFETEDMTVVRPYRLCNPVNKDGEGINDPTTHAMCYAVRDETPLPRFQRRTVQVENQFGTQTLVAVRPETLCVPAEKDGVPAVMDRDRFKCYRVMKKVRTPDFEEREVTLADQFEDKDTTVIKPVLLCNPVDEDGEGIEFPACHLVCYRIQDVPGQEPFVERAVSVVDEFSNEDVYPFRGTCRKASLLCVPSLKTELD